MVVLGLALLAPRAFAQTIEPAQTALDPNPGKISLAASYDFTNAYMFRGLLQDDTRLIMFPSAEARFDLHDGTDGVYDVGVRVGTWNSLHTGAAGTQGPSGKMWYESRFYTTVDASFGPGITVGGTYTAYPSPNNSFSTVKELSFRVGARGLPATGDWTIRPYGLVAFELDTAPGFGQADGGREAGTYLEVGVAPGLSLPDFTVAFPIKLGVSLDDYYELNGVDRRFGFLSLGAIASMPLVRSLDYGTWDVHGGVEFLSLGDTPEAFNGGDQTKLVGIVGIGFSF